MTSPPGTAVALLDAHMHVWELRRQALPWLRTKHPLKHDFTLSDLAGTTDKKTPNMVLVQANADPHEVEDLLALARQNPTVVGVVEWFDLLDFPDRLPNDPRLIKIRSPPADQTDPLVLTDPAHVQNVRAAANTGLAIDLLLHPSTLIGATQLASDIPKTRLVLDHLNNPTSATPK